jgi:pimeloyl-ACP methyl ester carboxylesterase
MTDIANASIRATADFYERSSGVKFFRAALNGAENVAPAVAVRLAQRLFLTPLPPKWAQRRQSWNPSWLIEPWSFERTTMTVYRRLTARSNGLSDAFETTKPHVLLIHGWGGSAAQMQLIADNIVDRGMVPILIEPPAHGRSGGFVSSLPQFARAIEYVATRLSTQGVPLYATVAHSLGASAAAFVQARGALGERLVLIAPPDRPRDFTQMFAKVFAISEQTRERMQQRIEAQEAAHMDAFASQALAPAIHVPTLIVHDEGDTINLFASATRWVSQMKHAHLYPTQGLGHRKILRDVHVARAIGEFVSSSTLSGFVGSLQYGVRQYRQ